MWLRRSVTALLLVSSTSLVVGAAPPGAGGQAAPATCGTSSPTKVVVDAPDIETGAPGTNVGYATGRFPYPRSYGVDLPDTDQDGTSDTIRVQGDGSVTVERGDGVVRFRHPGVKLWAGGVGDPGLGRGNDLVVFAIDGSGRGIGPGYWVDGSIAPGTFDPAAVGVGVGDGAGFTTEDRDGDRVADLLVLSYVPGDSDNGRTRLVSGAAVAAAEPGTDVSATATIGAMPGALFDFARIDGQSNEPGENGDRGGRLITIARTATSVTLRVGDGTDWSELTTTPEVVPAGINATYAQAWTSDEGPLLSLTLSTNDGTTTYWWALDPTCGAVLPGITDPEVDDPTTPTTPTTEAPVGTTGPAAGPSRPAVAADAVPGAPTFTG